MNDDIPTVHSAPASERRADSYEPTAKEDIPMDVSKFSLFFMGLPFRRSDRETAIEETK